MKVPSDPLLKCRSAFDVKRCPDASHAPEESPGSARVPHRSQGDGLHLAWHRAWYLHTLLQLHTRTDTASHMCAQCPYHLSMKRSAAQVDVVGDVELRQTVGRLSKLRPRSPPCATLGTSTLHEAGIQITLALPSPHRTTHAVARRSPSAKTQLSGRKSSKLRLLATVLPRFLGKA